jgi:GTP diphosphokinase / guanosine-3',5'-bis(diphosphate) 3'-diphosphatase
VMEPTKLSRAVVRAAEFHVGQFRDDGATPFLIHPLRTVAFLTKVLGVTDENVLCAAVLHDAIEDGPTNAARIIDDEFGSAILRIIYEVTFQKNTTYPQKTAALVAMMRTASPEAVMVKLADRLDNVRDMENWASDRRDRYLSQSRLMVMAARERFDTSYHDDVRNAVLSLQMFLLSVGYFL